MNRSLTIVKYQFVRDPGQTRFPAIKGISLDSFRGQLEYLRRHYTAIAMEDVIAAAADGQRGLPPRALLLTFDDGYADHYFNVLPVLDELGLQGSFFIPARAIVEHRVPDVDKVHYLLASVPDVRELAGFVFEQLDANRERFGLESDAYYYDRFSGDSGEESSDVIFIKRILQRELPEALRRELIDALFARYVSADERGFARELYMTPEQLQAMRDSGMYLGCHGWSHDWLTILDADAQGRDLDRALSFMAEIGVPVDQWAMAYPRGGYDSQLLEVLRVRGCVLALTADLGIADLDRHSPLTLPRLDTLDLPRDPDALPNDWTLASMNADYN